MQAIIRHRDLILPISLIGCIVVILTPLPAVILDMLIAGNITVAVLVLLTAIHVGRPLEFSVFPTLLLATTLARLVLNIATTRLILTGAARDGVSAAGNMIESFGTFVAGDRIEVGLIIFVILIVIQFVVITKGATRISEVAARFALDGMPGRQMAIDADLNAGVIDEQTAKARRDEITEQADFYGTMDGASKFVRGDAIAAIIITGVNIVGGLYVGVFHLDMTFSLAASTFTKLTIGDGLVSQLPALLISLAAGFLVTRSSKQTNLPIQILQQLLSNSRALSVAGCFLLVLVLTKLPAMPVMTLGAGCVGLALVVGRQQHQQQQLEDEHANLAALEAENAARRPRIEDLLTVDPMEISIGVGLLDLADPSRGGDLMERITTLRQSIAADLDDYGGHDVIIASIEDPKTPENARQTWLQ
ncbi:MAG: FHIPEP family type III secretion protein, partial [Rubripirellula sp.]